jgi:TetR/AcrR family transcriptional regulator, ethionamide resistance regulator
MAAPRTTTRRVQARSSRQEARERIVAAAVELVRRRSYEELSVGEVMERAGLGRTLFYRHFDDLADLLIRASRDAIDALYAAQRTLTDAPPDDDRALVRAAVERAVGVYQTHGPLLRAVVEASASDEEVAAGHSAMRRQFDGLVEQALRERSTRIAGSPPANLAETARALNLLNEAYLVDAFGREPRVSAETAVDTLTEVWLAVFAGE